MLLYIIYLQIINVRYHKFSLSILKCHILNEQWHGFVALRRVNLFFFCINIVTQVEHNTVLQHFPYHMKVMHFCSWFAHHEIA